MSTPPPWLIFRKPHALTPMGSLAKETGQMTNRKWTVGYLEQHRGISRNPLILVGVIPSSPLTPSQDLTMGDLSGDSSCSHLFTLCLALGLLSTPQAFLLVCALKVHCGRSTNAAEWTKSFSFSLRSSSFLTPLKTTTNLFTNEIGETPTKIENLGKELEALVGIKRFLSSTEGQVCGGDLKPLSSNPELQGVRAPGQECRSDLGCGNMWFDLVLGQAWEVWVTEIQASHSLRRGGDTGTPILVEKLWSDLWLYPSFEPTCTVCANLFGS